MAPPTSHLIRLPAELLKEIAGLCSMEDIFSLRAACRHLYNICDDTLVVQRSFLNHMPEPDSAYFPNKDALMALLKVRVSSQRPEDARAIWTRFAMAACRLDPLLHPAITLGNRDEYVLLYERPHNLVGLLSTLAALGYPSVLNRTMMAVLDHHHACLLLRSVSRHPNKWHLDSLHGTFLLQASFCIAIRNLNNPGDASSTSFGRHYEYIYSSYYIPRHQALRESEPIRGPFENRQASGMFRIAYMTSTLFRSGIWPIIGGPGTHDPPVVAHMNFLGRGEQLPLMDGASTPQDKRHFDVSFLVNIWMSPFELRPFDSSSSWLQWLRNRVDALIDNDLQEGDWAGWAASSSHAVRLPISRFAAQPSATDPDKVLVTMTESPANYLAGGSFTYLAELTRSNGRIAWEDGAGQLLQRFEGVVTALGIVGWVEFRGPNPLGRWNCWWYKVKWAKK